MQDVHPLHVYDGMNQEALWGEVLEYLCGIYYVLYGSALANPNGFSLNNHPRFIKRTKTKKSLLFSRNSLD